MERKNSLNFTSEKEEINSKNFCFALFCFVYNVQTKGARSFSSIKYDRKKPYI